MRSVIRGLARRPSSWTIVLAGPIVGYGYFWFVYLLAEAGCAEDLDLISTSMLRLVTLSAAVAAAAVTFFYAWHARRTVQAEARTLDDPAADDRRQNRRFMATTAVMLAALFLLFVLFITAPIAGSTLC
jgi:hypothetical protein